MRVIGIHVPERFRFWIGSDQYGINFEYVTIMKPSRNLVIYVRGMSITLYLLRSNIIDILIYCSTWDMHACILLFKLLYRTLFGE